MALSAVLHGVLIFAAFRVKGTYKIFDLRASARDAILVPRDAARFPVAVRPSPDAGSRAAGGAPPAEKTNPSDALPGRQASAAPVDAGAGRPVTSGDAAPESAADGAAGGRGVAGSLGFKLTYSAADAKISLSKPASAIEDVLVPSGLYRDYSGLNLSVDGPRAGGGGARSVRQAVPRAKGSAGGAAVAIKLPSLDFKPWAGQVLEKIQKSWSLPGGSGSGWKGEVGIRLMVARDGQVLGADLDAPSKIDLLDQAALKAVAAASPFPALPDAFTPTSLEVYLVFRYGD